jgi:signal transduction histidine kinase
VYLPSLPHSTFFKFKTSARFLMSLFLPLASFYGPLISGVFKDELYLKGPYQPLMCLLITLWVLNPKKDKAFFWISVILQMPFSGLTPYIGEWIKPNSIPNGIEDSLLSFTLVPFVFYLAALKVGHHIMTSREETLEVLQESNDRMLATILENEKLQSSQKQDLNNYDKKIKNLLYTNSHIWRAPVSNLLGLFQILENDLTQGKAIVNEELFIHIKGSIERLDHSIFQLNEEFNQDP